MKKLNFAFFGTPQLACQTLDILKNNGYLPSIIITSPPAPAGRGLNIRESSVSNWAQKNDIKCLKPEKIDQLFVDEFAKLNIDLSIVVAYGKILPESLIKLPKFETINIHYSLLPLYRGASPLESSLLNGDISTGISIQQMAYKLDTGPVIIEKEIQINISESKDEIRNKLIILGGNLLCEIIPKIINKTIIPKIQDETRATYCKKIHKSDGEIDINGNSKENYNKYRAFYGWPGVYFFKEKNGSKMRIKINEAIFENNAFIIKKVTPEGRKEISYENFLKQS